MIKTSHVLRVSLEHGCSKKNSPAGRGHSREVWVEVCHRDLQTLILIKTKISRPIILWSWFVSFCIQIASLLHPSHGSLRFVTSRSRFRSPRCETKRKTKRLRRRLLLEASGRLVETPCSRSEIVNFYTLLNHNYDKILKSDWLSAVLISALKGQCNRTVRVMPK